MGVQTLRDCGLSQTSPNSGVMLTSRSIFLALALALPARAGAQERAADDLFTWSGRLTAGATLSIRHYNGPIEVRESTTDRVEFRAERRSRRSSEMSFQVQNEGNGVTICGVWRGRTRATAAAEAVGLGRRSAVVAPDGPAAEGVGSPPPPAMAT